MSDARGAVPPFDAGLPRLPGYELLEPLGAGASGTVFLAAQARTGNRVAVKLSKLDGDERRTARFHREAGLCARLHHPHVVQLLDAGEDGAYIYTVFQYVPGETLRSHLLRCGSLGAVEAGRLMGQVLDALDCAHRAGVVHRDLKPENIMVTRTGALAHAMVLDFGIGTLLPQADGSAFPALTMTAEFLGTPSYSAPEQLRGEPPGTQSDLYAWGLIFLECLTGHPAVGGTSQAEIFHRQLSAQELPLPPGIASHPLGAVLRRALRKNAAERCAAAAPLLDELRRTRLDDLVGDFAPPEATLDPALLRTTAALRGFAEKRQITVLCCAVNVWSETADDPADIERSELAQREEFSVFSDAASRRGGLVAGVLGGHMVVVFGYPYACDTDARRAGTTALDLVALARRRADALRQARCGRLEVRLGAHIGLGVVTPGEPPSGHAVNLAMRLAGLAAPGTALVSTACAAMLGASGFHAVDAGALGDGDAGLGRAFMLQPQAATAGPVGAGWLHTLRVGRESEFDRLWAAWQQAAGGAGGAIVVQGEPGIGKSCLVDGLRARLQAEGMRALAAQCLPEHRNNALAPMLALLRHVLEEPGAADGDALRARLQAQLEGAGCDAAREMPIFCAWFSLPFGPLEASQVSPALQKRLLLQAMVRWLGSLSKAAPLALFVEDLHWADPTTLELLELLAAAAPAERQLLVLTARPAWIPPASLPVQTLALARLDAAQAAAVARHALAPRELDARVVEHIVARTDGVPLFVQEFSKALAQSHLVERDGLWCFRDDDERPAPIPATLRDSLIARFDRLEPAREVLQLAAAIGRRFDLELLRGCLRQADTLDDALRLLREAGLVAELEDSAGQAFVFRHALIRDTAYDCMVQAQQRMRHRAVARAMARLYPQRLVDEPDTVARHYALAGEHVQAVELGIRQLGITQRRSLNDDTLAYAREVNAWIEQLAPDDRAAARLDVTGFETQALMNKHGWAHPQIEARVALSQQLLEGPVAYDREVRHLWSMITYHHVASHRAEVRRLSERLGAIAQARRDDDVLVAADTYAGLADYSDGRFADAELRLTAAIDRYEPRRHAHHAAVLGFDTRVWATAGRALVRWFAGHEGASADAAQAVEWGREIGHQPSLCMALLYQGLGLQARDDRAGAARLMDELLALAQRYDLPAFHGYAHIIRCWAEGDVAQADATLEFLWQMGCRYCQTYYRAFAADTLAAQGRWDDALVRLDHAIVLVDELDERLYESELHLARGRCLQGRAPGDPEAVAAFRRAADLAEAAGKARTLALALGALQAAVPTIPLPTSRKLPHEQLARQ